MQKNSIIKVFFTKKMLSCFLLGISSGLPLLLIGSTFKAWMKEAGVDLGIIGLFALVGMPYTLKFLWAFLFDKISLGFLDRRRGWIVVLQLCLAFCIYIMSVLSPKENLSVMALVTFIIAFLSASQDIVIDAYRREILDDHELGLGSSLAVNGYRVGMLLAGAFALPLADFVGWSLTYVLMSLIMLGCVFITLMSPQDEYDIKPNSFLEAVVGPFLEYFKKSGAIEILFFILLFKIGDQIASEMFTPFYLDLGFSKTQIGVVSKFYGFWATIIGGLLGGAVIIKIGILRSLWIFGILQALSTACFAFLSFIGPNLVGLIMVVGFENLTSGMGTSAFVAFMMSLCDKKFSASQYALLSSFMGVPRVIFGSQSGFLVKFLGWYWFFIFCACIAIFGIMMLVRAPKWNKI